MLVKKIVGNRIAQGAPGRGPGRQPPPGSDRSEGRSAGLSCNRWNSGKDRARFGSGGRRWRGGSPRRTSARPFHSCGAEPAARGRPWKRADAPPRYDEGGGSSRDDVTTSPASRRLASASRDSLQNVSSFLREASAAGVSCILDLYSALPGCFFLDTARGPELGCLLEHLGGASHDQARL